MAAIREKTLVNIDLEGHCESHTLTRVRIRHHEMTIDEPVPGGGTDLAPTPLGTLLASLIGCTNVILHKIAARDDHPRYARSPRHHPAGRGRGAVP